MSIALVCFWVSALAVGYTYVGYPALLWVWSRWVRRRASQAPYEPSVSVVVAAYNEGHLLRRRIQNMLMMDYPRSRIEIIVVSDGSTDDTDEVVAGFADVGVVLLRQEHAGKAPAINLGVKHASGEIIVFADARQTFERNAISALTRNFNDPKVGAVSGELMLREGVNPLAPSLGGYWAYEKWLRKMESSIDSTVGATGAIYAIRRELFRPMPPDTILDDVYTPMQVVLQGYRTVFEPAAIAYDEISSRPESEKRRKIRTLTGNYQLLRLVPSILSPYRNRVWFQYMSHKVGRLAAPILLIAMAAANLCELHGFYLVTLGLQGALYSLAAAGALIGRRRREPWITSLPHAFVMMNWAALIGLVYFATGRKNVWVKS